MKAQKATQETYALKALNPKKTKMKILKNSKVLNRKKPKMEVALKNPEVLNHKTADLVPKIMEKPIMKIMTLDQLQKRENKAVKIQFKLVNTVLARISKFSSKKLIPALRRTYWVEKLVIILEVFFNCLEKFVNFTDSVIDLLCKNKKITIEFIKKAFMRIYLKKFRMMLDCGSRCLRALALLKKRFSWGWLQTLTKKIENAVKKVGRSIVVKSVSNGYINDLVKAGKLVKNKAEQSGNFMQNSIFRPIFNKFIKPIKKNKMYFID